MNKRTAVTVSLAIFSIACGGPAPQQTPAPTATATPAPSDPAVQPGQVMQQAVQSMQQSGLSANAVAFEQLVALLPDVNGWTRGKPRGEQVTMGVKMSHAKAEYQKGESSIDLDITDSSFNQLVLSPFSMFLAAGFSERTTNGFARSAPMGGNPGFERWNNEAGEGEVVVVINNRFIVQAKGRSIENITPVKTVVQAVNLAALSGLK